MMGPSVVWGRCDQEWLGKGKTVGRGPAGQQPAVAAFLPFQVDPNARLGPKRDSSSLGSPARNSNAHHQGAKAIDPFAAAVAALAFARCSLNLCISSRFQRRSQVVWTARQETHCLPDLQQTRSGCGCGCAPGCPPRRTPTLEPALRCCHTPPPDPRKKPYPRTLYTQASASLPLTAEVLTPPPREQAYSPRAPPGAA